MTFTKMASLNGVQMFLKSQNIKLINTLLPDMTVVWKEFADSITLISIASGTTKLVLDNFLNAVFNSMVFVAGIDEIKNPRNVEKLKKELRNCYCIVDKLLDCLDIGNRTIDIDLINMSSSMLCHEKQLLNNCLDMLMENLDSTYGCILVHGCIASATQSWLKLDKIEIKLLIMTVLLDTSCTSCDLPVFLPKMSPNIAFRLVSVMLIKDVHILALCGPHPELIEIEKLTIQYWKNHVDTLRIAEKNYPKCLPIDLALDPAILGLLLVDIDVGKFIVSRNSSQLINHQIGTHRIDILKTFWYEAVEPFLLGDKNKNCDSDVDDDVGDDDDQKHHAKETYWCSEYHKCHALKDNNNILCVLYTFSIPNHTMRLITSTTLKNLTSDKQLLW